ncbi:MAG: hypothetical protein V8R64_13200 [Thomasclavelia sp.]
MKKGIVCSVLMASLLGTTSVMTPLMTVPIYAESIVAPTNQYSTDTITTVNNGTGAIDASGRCQ